MRPRTYFRKTLAGGVLLVWLAACGSNILRGPAPGVSPASSAPAPFPTKPLSSAIEPSEIPAPSGTAMPVASPPQPTGGPSLTPPSATAVPMASPPSGASPGASDLAIRFFRADREAIMPGETFTLTWESAGAVQAWLYLVVDGRLTQGVAGFSHRLPDPDGPWGSAPAAGIYAACVRFIGRADLPPPSFTPSTMPGGMVLREPSSGMSIGPPRGLLRRLSTFRARAYDLDSSPR